MDPLGLVGEVALDPVLQRCSRVAVDQRQHVQACMAECAMTDGGAETSQDSSQACMHHDKYQRNALLVLLLAWRLMHANRWIHNACIPLWSEITHL